MIDVHYVINDPTKLKKESPYFGDFLRSISRNKGIYREIDNRGESLTTGRVKGFKVGRFPLVASVDPDDILLPDVIEECVSLMEETSLAIVTQEYKVIRNNYLLSPPSKSLDYSRVRSNPSYLHHVAIFRRKYVEEFINSFLYYLDFQGDSIFLDWLLIVGALQLNRLQYVPSPGYVWRIHDNNYHKEEPWRTYKTLDLLNTAIFQNKLSEINRNV